MSTMTEGDAEASSGKEPESETPVGVTESGEIPSPSDIDPT